MSKEPYVDKCCKDVTPPSDFFVIKINEGEIPVWPRVFYRMKTSGYLISWERDENDPVKVIGKTEDGDIYVSELTDDEMTDEEFDAYYARKGITDETVEQLFSQVENGDNDALYNIHLRSY